MSKFDAVDPAAPSTVVRFIWPWSVRLVRCQVDFHVGGRVRREGQDEVGVRRIVVLERQVGRRQEGSAPMIKTTLRRELLHASLVGVRLVQESGERHQCDEGYHDHRNQDPDLRPSFQPLHSGTGLACLAN